ncbi:hypothetical protein ALQ04_05422 [Pseudomonas cichorii]|uniref:Uncharacterized protein n=1 Tax=Pseudomonas cichorii TaxID=36746 RepID=A0A3M4LH47_PSECI|nr:hypothetical protein ALQ04_05422 [Pseudomonas cichorii]
MVTFEFRRLQKTSGVMALDQFQNPHATLADPLAGPGIGSIVVMQQKHGPAANGEMPGRQHTQAAIQLRLQRHRGAVDGTEQNVLAGFSTSLAQCIHGTESHLLIRGPDQADIRVALEQHPRLLLRPVAAPATQYDLAQVNLGKLGKRPAHALLTCQGNRRRVGAGKRQHLDRTAIVHAGIQADQALCSQIAALLVITDQAADEVRIANGEVTEDPHLILGQGIVDGQQPDATAFGQAQHLGGHIQLVGKHQIVRTRCVALQRFSRHIQQLSGIAIGVQHLERHPGRIGSRLHDTGVAVPIAIGSKTRAEKDH